MLEKNVWNELYREKGPIHQAPSSEVTNLASRMRLQGKNRVLDAGCGTGRHTSYLTQQGFDAIGLDISKASLLIARQRDPYSTYAVAALKELPLPDQSIDWIIANHSLQYATSEGVISAKKEMDRVLSPSGALLLRVASDKHIFAHANAEEIFGFSHIGRSIQAGLPVQFFSEDHVRSLFWDYSIERLEHIEHEPNHDQITIPLNEWVMLAYKD